MLAVMFQAIHRKSKIWLSSLSNQWYDTAQLWDSKLSLSFLHISERFSRLTPAKLLCLEHTKQLCTELTEPVQLFTKTHIYTRRYMRERDIYIYIDSVCTYVCVSTLGVTTCVPCACVCSAKRWPAPSSGMAAREEAASLVKGNLQPYIPTMAGMCNITQTQMLRAPVAIPGCPSAVWPLVPQHVHIQGIHPVWWFAITRKVWKHTAQNY